MKTLAELNTDLEARGASRSRFSVYTTRQEFVVSNMNRGGRQGAYSTGTKAHLAINEVVIAEEGPHQPGTVRVGETLSLRPFCNGNGQRRGGVLKGLDTDAITCKPCLKTLARLSQSQPTEGNPQ